MNISLLNYSYLSNTLLSLNIHHDLKEIEDKRLHNAQKGLDKLDAMPSPKERDKQIALEKAQQLKSRLHMLRMMLAAASPSEAKAIAAQLQSIARQLAGLAPALRNTQNDANSTHPQNTATTINHLLNISNSSENKDIEVNISNIAQTISHTENQNTPHLDQDLKKIIKETANALKSALTLFKQKFSQYHHDKTNEAEKDLAQINQELGNFLPTESVSDHTNNITCNVDNYAAPHINITI